MAIDPEAPRLRPVEPPDVRDAEVDAADLLPGDLVEGVRYAELDIAGRRLTELEVDECVLEVLRADDADLRGLRIRDTVIGTFDAPVLRAARTTWQRVRIQSGRVGSAELYDSGFDGVLFEGLKLGFVNLRASKLTDVLFRDCTIDELDLDGAQLQRVAFEGCAVREVTGSARRSGGSTSVGRRSTGSTGSRGSGVPRSRPTRSTNSRRCSRSRQGSRCADAGSSRARHRDGRETQS